jgi:hypothetical protein
VATDDAGLFGIVGGVVDQVRHIAFRQPVPPNDNFNARVPLSGDLVRLEADNGGAGREAGEPATSGEQTLWWSWTAPASKNYYVLARGLLGSPQISIFTGDALAALNSVSSDENSGCGNLAWGFLVAQAGQTYQISVGDSCESFGGPLTLHILPTDGAPQIADAHVRRGGEVANAPVFELFAVGMQQLGWTVEFSADLQMWEPCDTEWPYGWVDGVSNWADTFRAHLNSTGPVRFYRLHRTP